MPSEKVNCVLLLDKAERLFLTGRIPQAAKTFFKLLAGGRSALDPDKVSRMNLLAINLYLLADQPDEAESRLHELRKTTTLPQCDILEAKLLSLGGETEAAVELLGKALEASAGSRNMILGSSILHERGLLHFDTGDLPSGEADLSEAARLAEIAGKREMANLIRLDLADALLCAGYSSAALQELPRQSTLSGSLKARADFNRRRAEQITGATTEHKVDLKGEVNTLSEINELMWAIGTNIGSRPQQCLNSLDNLETEGWCDALAVVRAEAILFRAAVEVENSHFDSAHNRLSELNKVFSPGIVSRFSVAADRLRIRCAEGQGNYQTALSVGRKILQHLESRRGGLNASSQLKKLSLEHEELYRKLITLEMNYGKTERAFETLQMFTARGLLDKTIRRKAARLERSLAPLNSAATRTRQDPGTRTIRKLLGEKTAGISKPVSWKQAVSLLRKLSSGNDDYESD